MYRSPAKMLTARTEIGFIFTSQKAVFDIMFMINPLLIYYYYFILLINPLVFHASMGWTVYAIADRHLAQFCDASLLSPFSPRSYQITCCQVLRGLPQPFLPSTTDNIVPACL